MSNVVWSLIHQNAPHQELSNVNIAQRRLQLFWTLRNLKVETCVVVRQIRIPDLLSKKQALCSKLTRLKARLCDGMRLYQCYWQSSFTLLRWPHYCRKVHLNFRATTFCTHYKGMAEEEEVLDWSAFWREKSDDSPVLLQILRCPCRTCITCCLSI